MAKSKQSSSMQPTQAQAQAGHQDGQLCGSAHHAEIVKQLQEYWTCEAHTTLPEMLIYCWRNPDDASGKCHGRLTHTHLGQWAYQVVHTSAFKFCILQLIALLDV